MSFDQNFCIVLQYFNSCVENRYSRKWYVEFLDGKNFIFMIKILHLGPLFTFFTNRTLNVLDVNMFIEFELWHAKSKVGVFKSTILIKKSLLNVNRIMSFYHYWGFKSRTFQTIIIIKQKLVSNSWKHIQLQQLSFILP